MFWIEFASNIDAFNVFINIDEVIFSTSTKINYSWTIKGNQNLAYNSNFKGSSALIGAITSQGDWFFSPLNSKSNSNIFISFIEELLKWLSIDLKIETQRIIQLMDNSQIHTSKKWMEYFKEQKWRIMFLAPYWSQFAPIELMFNNIKREYAYNPNQKLSASVNRKESKR